MSMSVLRCSRPLAVTRTLLFQTAGIRHKSAFRHEISAVNTHFLHGRRFYSSDDEKTRVFKRRSDDEKTRVKRILQLLKEDIKRQDVEEDRREREKALQIQTDAKPKVPLFSKERASIIKVAVVRELKHYYHGFRLLALEMRLSFKYLWRLVKGTPLSRRERQQLVRTLQDTLRLVPFSVFIIVPFMEFALPFYLKLFPRMLPSTFQESSKEEERIRNQLKTRVETANFLQETLEEIALRKKKDSNQKLAYEFSQFVKKIRAEEGYVSNTELFKFIKLFEDDFTLDNLSMSHLRGLCRLLGVQTFGTPEILRLQLHLKLNELKRDDRLIEAEGGVDVLSAQELQAACRARGMRALGVSENRLKHQLKEWLDLSMDDQVPPSLLLLSRAMFFPEELTFEERLRSVLSSLPEEIVEETRQKLSEMEGDRVDPKARVEFLKNIESALNKEREAEEDAEERAEKSKIKIDIDGIESKLNEQLDASERAEELEEAELAQRELEKMRKEVKKLDEKISEESGLSSNNNNDANGTANKKSAENGLPNKMDNNPIVQLPSTHQLEGSKGGGNSSRPESNI